jgi:hypothetical protein
MPGTDAFANYAKSLEGPATKAANVTPSDSTTLDVTRALHCKTTSGLVYVDFPEGGTNVALWIEKGAILPVRVNKVYLTGTDAAGIVALY